MSHVTTRSAWLTGSRLTLLEQEEPSLSITSIIDEIADTPPDDSVESELRSGFWDASEEIAEAAFLELSRRAGWLGDRYPLAIQDDVVSIGSRIPHAWGISIPPRCLGLGSYTMGL